MKLKRNDVRMVPLGSLRIDHKAQRYQIPSRVKYLARNWDTSRIGTLLVSLREDNHYYVINGQHRVEAARMVGAGPNFQFRCDVRLGLTREQEAELFLAENDVRVVTPFEKYRVGLTAEDETALGIRSVARKHGLKIQDQARDGVLNCVSELQRQYHKDPEVLNQVLGVITDAWGGRHAGLERTVIGGLSTVMSRYNGEIDRDNLVTKLQKYRGGPSALIGDARGIADLKHTSVNKAFAEVVVTAYNRGKRSKQLEPF